MELTAKQKKGLKFLLNTDRGINYVLFGGAAGGGKSWLGCFWLLSMCSRFPGVRYFVGRNNLKDSRESVMVTFDKVCQSVGFASYRKNDSGIMLSNGSSITLLDLTYYPIKDPMFQRLGSKEYTGGYLEEAGEIHPLAFEVLKSRIGRHLNVEYGIPSKMFITCNPQKNWLYGYFYKPWREGKLLPPYAFIQSLNTDNPYLSEEYIRGLQSIEDKVTRQRLLEGLWEYDNDPSQLCPYDAISDMFTNDYVKEGESALSADIALKGRDRYIAGYWRGLVVRIVSDIPYIKADRLEEDIRDKAKTYGIARSRIVVDSDGNGSYLGDYISGITEFHGGASAYDGRKYANLKSECAFKLAYFVNKRMIHVVCNTEQRERLSQEMECLRQARVDNDTAKLSIISKDEMKKVLGRSPDTLDMLIMGMVYHVKPTYSGGSVRIYKD